MNYLLDRKIKRKKFFSIIFSIILLIILFYFRFDIFIGLSNTSQIIFRPVLIVGNSIGAKFKSIRPYFISKNALYFQNQKLQIKVRENDARNSNYNSVVAENISLKEILGRNDAKVSMTLAAILSKPNQSFYNTLVIDAGMMQGLKTGDTVFALGNVPIGRVDLVYANYSKVILFSSAGEKTQAIVSDKNIFVELAGRGGGNFEIIIPRDFILQKGDQVVMPGLRPYILAEVVKIISDERDSFVKALLMSPVNVQELKFVEVSKLSN